MNLLENEDEDKDKKLKMRQSFEDLYRGKWEVFKSMILLNN